MLFDPSSRICVCEVPFDNSYKNVVYFANHTEQTAYFSKRVVKIFTDYLIVREALPDGGVRSSIKVAENIATLRSLRANYVYWTNSNHSDKVFYAFITDMIYVNEKTTRLVIETDVYQTWRFEANLLDSFVVREHSVTDEIGDNRIPEKFDIEDYEYEPIEIAESVLQKWGYLTTTSEPQGDGLLQTYLTVKHSGIYQGLHFYYHELSTEVSSFLKRIMEEDGDVIQSVSVIPWFCVSQTAEMDDNGWIGESSSPASRIVYIDYQYKYEGFTPKNNKLFTAPYYKIMVTNNIGTEAEYCIEDFAKDFEGNYKVSFNMYGDISIKPSVMIVPRNYRKTEENPDFGMSLGDFPQCSFNSDTFKLWLAKSWGGIATRTGSAVGSTIGGLAMAASMANPAIGGAMALGSVISGASAIASEVGNIVDHSKEPNKAHIGGTSNNLITAMKKNRFDYYEQKIKVHMAQRLDDFFTMFGYQTNKLKTPNVSSRPYFNYVQTIDVNITGGIPQDDMLKLKSIYNNGVTLWKPNATIGDYSVDNSAGGN